MSRLIAQLYSDQAAPSSKASEVVPVNWLEAKIQKIRKYAIESTKSLSMHSWQTTALALSNKEIVMSTQNPDTQRVHRFNLKLLSTVNMHRVWVGQVIQCHSFDDIFGCHCDKTLARAVKAGLVLIPFEQIQDLNDDVLKILCEVDGIMTPQLKSVDLQEWFDKLFKIYKEDQEKSKEEQKYANLLDVVILFVSEDDFKKAQQEPEAVSRDESLEKLTPFARYLQILKQHSGIDTHRLMFYLKDVDTSAVT
jgi:hypothetical protein